MSKDAGGERDLGRRRTGDLLVRLASAAVLLPIALICVFFGSWPFFILVAAGAAVVFAEWAYVIDHSAHLFSWRPEIIAGALASALVALVAGSVGAGDACLLALAGVVAIAMATRSAWLAAGAVYAAALAIPAPAIRADSVYGFDALMIILVTVWATDSFAFFVGRTVGGPKLWPRMSPKKTWSGSIGGLVGSVVCGLALAFFVGVPLSVGLCLLLIALSVASQLGDLLESAVKRRFDKKDSSAIIPGHGGLMDRIDGLVAAGTLALLVGWLHGGGEAIAAGVLFW